MPFLFGKMVPLIGYPNSSQKFKINLSIACKLTMIIIYFIILTCLRISALNRQVFKEQSKCSAVVSIVAQKQ